MWRHFSAWTLRTRETALSSLPKGQTVRPRERYLRDRDLPAGQHRNPNPLYKNALLGQVQQNTWRSDRRRRAGKPGPDRLCHPGLPQQRTLTALRKELQQRKCQIRKIRRPSAMHLQSRRSRGQQRTSLSNGRCHPDRESPTRLVHQECANGAESRSCRSMEGSMSSPSAFPLFRAIQHWAGLRAMRAWLRDGSVDAASASWRPP